MEGDAGFISTGRLPSPEQVRRAVTEAHARYRMVAEGDRSRVYPALAQVPAGRVRHLRGRDQR